MSATKPEVYRLLELIISCQIDEDFNSFKDDIAFE